MPENKVLTAEELDKLRAEADLARATARWHAAEAAKAEAEAAKAAAEAAKSRTELAAAEFAAAENARKAALTLAGDDRHHVYTLATQVNSGSVGTLINHLRLADRTDPEAPITIVIDSPGGSVIDGMALFDEISALSIRGGGSHVVTTVVRGYAASMGGILVQAGDVRKIGQESYFMIHEVSSAAGGKIGEIKDEVAFLDTISERIAAIFVDRSGGKISRRAFVNRWSRKDWWMDSREALKFGFVDAIG